MLTLCFVVFVFSINLLLFLVVYLVRSNGLFWVCFFWEGFGLHVLLGYFGGFFLRFSFCVRLWRWIDVVVWCWVVVLSKGVFFFEVLFVLVDEMLDSDILWGLVNLCGNIWFVSVFDKFGLFEFGSLSVFVGRLGVAINSILLLFIFHLWDLLVISYESFILVWFSVFLAFVSFL